MPDTCSSRYLPPFGERPASPDEAALIRTILEANAQMMKKVAGGAHRAQHPKGHGLLSGRLLLRDDIPQPYRAGLFAQAGSFDAQVRFSNGGSYDDARPDAHGMAIKLHGVPGEKLQGPCGMLDLILLDSEPFFEGDLEDYAEFNDFLAEVVGFDRNRTDLIEAVAKVIFIKAKRMVMQRLGAEPSLVESFADQVPISPLRGMYWSTVPYALGDIAVKWEAVPVDQHAALPVEGADGIFDALAEDLEQGPWAFDINALVQPDWQRFPVDDPTIPWLPEAQRVPLARLEIDAMDRAELEASRAEGERIAFNPWHTLPEMRPLGAINRARRLVYEELSRRRLGAD